MASADDYVEQTFPIECKGRGLSRREVLDFPADARVKVYKSLNSSTISSEVLCNHYVDSNGGICTASRFNEREFCPGTTILCPYSFDIPYALERILGFRTKIS